jgi:hypothetical protein
MNTIQCYTYVDVCTPYSLPPTARRSKNKEDSKEEQKQRGQRGGTKNKEEQQRQQLHTPRNATTSQQPHNNSTAIPLSTLCLLQQTVRSNQLAPLLTPTSNSVTLQKVVNPLFTHFIIRDNVVIQKITKNT